MENIIDIIYDYSVRNKLIDKKAIKSIINTSINIYNIDTIDKVMFSNTSLLTDDFTMAGYDVDNFIIIIYMNAIKKEIQLNSQLTDFKIEDELNKFEMFARKNLHLLHIILHEIEHAKQAKLVRNIHDVSLERKLVHAEFNYANPSIIDPCTYLPSLENIKTMVKNRLLYDTCYDISLMERLADYYSLNDIKNMSKILSANLYNLQDLILIDNLLREYKNELDSPTERFFEKINKSQVLIQSPYLKYEDRLKYGLRLTKNEYYNLKEKLNVSKGK